MRFVLIVCILLGTSCQPQSFSVHGVGWDKRTGAFAWRGGDVKVPSGFTYQAVGGGDTFEGRFNSPDGKVVIHFDIG